MPSKQLNLMRKARRPLHWLAVALLLFAQVSLASHYHDAAELPSHECTACSQLQLLEHAAGHAGVFLFPENTGPSRFYAQIAAPDSSGCLLPPCRAPPLA